MAGPGGPLSAAVNRAILKKKQAKKKKEDKERREAGGNSTENPTKGSETHSGKHISKKTKKSIVIAKDPEINSDKKDTGDMMTKEIGFKRAMTDKVMTNKQKCIVLGSRNMTSKDRHLLLDMKGLLPHGRDHSKLTSTENLGNDLVEIATLHHCNAVMFLEAHRHDVAYLWMAQAPNGPSVKFQLSNMHTADELRMSGNCLKFSRPLLHFDREFENLPHLRVMRSLLQQIFNTPRYHPKSKPFVDHMFCFYYLDGHIWFRNYQIIDSQPMNLMEIGPRFTLQPVAIFNGCCKGEVLWKNKDVLAPTEVRRNRKVRALLKMKENEHIRHKSETHRKLNPDPIPDPLDSVFK